MKLNELCLICILHFAFCTSIIFCPIPSFRMPWLLERRKLIYTSNVKLLYFRIDCKCPIPIKISFSFFSSIALPFNPPGKRANAVENSKDFTFQKRTAPIVPWDTPHYCQLEVENRYKGSNKNLENN